MNYRFELANPISTNLLAAFPELRPESEDTAGAILDGVIVDQAHLHSVLHRIESLGLTLVEVRRLP